MHLDVHILSVAGQAHAQGGGEGHDLMRAESFAVADIHVGPAHGFLEIAHHIQMADEFHVAIFAEFNPDFHNAVMHVENEELGENVVAAEFQKGYTYKETVVRHSMVQVAN